MTNPRAIFSWMWIGGLLLPALACDGRTATEGPLLDSIAVVPAAFELSVGSELQLEALTLDRNGVSFAGGVAISWSTESDLVASVSPRGLALGVTPGETRIAASSGGVMGYTAVTVVPLPILALDPSNVTFTTTVGTDPASQTVAASNTGGGQLGALSIGPTTHGLGEPTGWLTAVVTDGSTLTLRAFAGTLVAGFYSASFEVRAANATNNPLTVDVGFLINP